MEPTETKQLSEEGYFGGFRAFHLSNPIIENQAYRQDLLGLNSYTQVAMRESKDVGYLSPSLLFSHPCPVLG